MERIGIVGAGVAGLHLALYLQQHGVPARLYAERTPAAQRGPPWVRWRLDRLALGRSVGRGGQHAGVVRWGHASFPI
jgi:2-polyprenyl-6-methoxyphenol hydroxylase-like FAD-dependent oxidoreductase